MPDNKDQKQTKIVPNPVSPNYSLQLLGIDPEDQEVPEGPVNVFNQQKPAAPVKKFDPVATQRSVKKEQAKQDDPATYQRMQDEDQQGFLQNSLLGANAKAINTQALAKRRQIAQDAMTIDMHFDDQARQAFADFPDATEDQIQKYKSRLYHGAQEQKQQEDVAQVQAAQKAVGSYSDGVWNAATDGAWQQVRPYAEKSTTSNKSAVDVSDLWDADGKPTLAFRQQIFERAQGDLSRFPEVAQQIAQNKIDVYRQSPTIINKAIQGTLDYLHESGETGNAPALAAYYGLSGTISAAKALTQIGGFGGYVLQQMNPLASESANDQHFADWNNAINAVPVSASDEAPMTLETLRDNPLAYLDATLASTSRMVGDMSPMLATGGSSTLVRGALGQAERSVAARVLGGEFAEAAGIANTPANKAYAKLYQALNGADQSYIPKFMDNTIGMARGFYPQTYSRNYSELVNKGYSPDQASKKAFDRSAIEIALMSVASPFAEPAQGMQGVSGAIMNATERTAPVSFAGRMADYTRTLRQNALSIAQPSLLGATGLSMAHVAGEYENHLDDIELGKKSEKDPFDWKAVAKGTAEGFLSGALTFGINHAATGHGFVPDNPQAHAIGRAASAPEEFYQSVDRQIEKRQITPEQGVVMKTFVKTITPEFQRASSMVVENGIDAKGKPVYKPRFTPAESAQYAVEATRLKQTAERITALSGHEGLAKGVREVDGKLVAPDPSRNNMLTEEAGQRLQAELNDLTQKAGVSQKTLQKMDEGTFTQGRIIPGTEMAAIAQRYTPNESVSLDQSNRIAAAGPFKTESANIQGYINDPEVMSYVQQLQPKRANSTTREKAAAGQAGNSIITESTSGAPLAPEEARYRQATAEDQLQVNAAPYEGNSREGGIPLDLGNKIEDFKPVNTNPVVIDADGNIIDGKKRVAYALVHGQTELDVARPVRGRELSEAITDETQAHLGNDLPDVRNMPQDAIPVMDRARQAYNERLEQPLTDSDIDADIHSQEHAAVNEAAKVLLAEGVPPDQIPGMLVRLTGNAIPPAQGEAAVNQMIEHEAHTALSQAIDAAEPMMREVEAAQLAYDSAPENKLQAAAESLIDGDLTREQFAQALPTIESGITSEQAGLLHDELTQVPDESLPSNAEQLAQSIEATPESSTLESNIPNEPRETNQGNTGIQNAESAQNPDQAGREEAADVPAKRKEAVLKGDYKRAVEVETNDPRDMVMQYFIANGRLNTADVKTFFNNSPKELQSKIWMQKGDGPTIDGLAHALWEEYEGQFGDRLEGQDKITTSEFKNAIEDVMSSYSGRRSMAEELAVKHPDSIAEREYNEWLEGEKELKEQHGDAFEVAAERLASLTPEEVDRLIAEEAEGQDAFAAEVIARESPAKEVSAEELPEAAEPTINIKSNRPNVFASDEVLQKAGWTIRARTGSSEGVKLASIAGMQELLQKLFGKDTAVVVLDNESVARYAEENPDLNLPLDAKGWYQDGKVFINAERATGATAIHEISHVWQDWAEQQAPEIYSRGLELATQTEAFRYAESLLDSEAANEGVNEGVSGITFSLPESEKALLKRYAEAYSGRENARDLLAREVLSHTIENQARTIAGDDVNQKGMAKQFRQWLNDFFTALAKKSGFRGMGAKEFADLTLSEYSQKALEEIGSGRALTQKLKEALETQKIKTKERLADKPADKKAAVVDESIARSIEERGDKTIGARGEDGGDLLGVHKGDSTAMLIADTQSPSDIYSVIELRSPKVADEMLQLVQQTEAYKNYTGTEDRQQAGVSVLLDMIADPRSISSADQKIIGGLVKRRGVESFLATEGKPVGIGKVYDAFGEFVRAKTGEDFNPRRLATAYSDRAGQDRLAVESQQERSRLAKESAAPLIGENDTRAIVKEVEAGRMKPKDAIALYEKLGLDVPEPVKKAKSKQPAFSLPAEKMTDEEYMNQQRAFDSLGVNKKVLAEAIRAVGKEFESTGSRPKSFAAGIRVIEKAQASASDFTAQQRLNFRALMKQYYFEAGKESVKKTIDNATKTSTDGKVLVDEYASLKNQLRMEAKASREGFRAGVEEGKQKGFFTGARIENADQKVFSERIAAHLKAAQTRGEVSDKVVKSLIRKAAGVGTNTAKLDAFLDYADKVFADADYADKVRTGEDTRSSIRSAVKSKTSQQAANNITSVGRFLKLNPEAVSDINQYQEIADKVLATAKFAKVRINGGVGEVINDTYETDNAAMEQYVDGQVKHIEQVQKDRLASQYDDLVQQGIIDPATMSLMDINTILDSIHQTPDVGDAYLLDQAKSAEKLRAMREVVDYQKMGLDDYIKNNGFSFSTEQQGVLKELNGLKVESLDLKQLAKFNDVINNVIVNGSLAGAGDLAILSKTIRDTQQLQGKLKAANINFGKLRSGLSDLASINLMTEFITKNTKMAAEVQRLTGISGIYDGHARAKKLQDNTVDEYLRLKTSLGKDIDSAPNRYRRGVYARVSQHYGGSPEEINQEFNRTKSLVMQTADRLTRSTVESEQREGKIVQQVYDELLDGSIDASEVKAKMDQLNAGNGKMVDFWAGKFAGRQALTFENAELYDNKLPDPIVNYTSTKLKGTNGVRGVGEQEAKDIFAQTFFSKKIDNSMAGTKNSREKYEVLPKDSALDLDFDSVQSRRFYETNYDIETNKAIAQARNFFAGESADALLGDSGNRQLMQDAVKQSVSHQKGQSPEVSAFWKTASKAVNVLQAKGARIALGSVSQALKQYPSVAFNTLVNLGSDIGLYGKALRISNKLPLFDKYNIGQRGDTKAGYNRQVDLNEIDRTDFGNNVRRAAGSVQKVSEKLADLALTSLVKSDVSVARTSWLSYYMKDLQRQGVNVDNIDWQKEHLNSNDEAAAYAEQMVSRNQNANDASSMGNFYKNSKGADGILKNIILPFSTFSTNQRVRMTNDIQKLVYGSKADRVEAGKSMAATAVEQVLFNALKVYVLGALTTAGARAVAGQFGMWNDEDEKKAAEREDVTIKVGDKSVKTSAKFKKLAANTLSDFFFSGMGGATQTGLQKGLNGVYGLMATEEYANGKSNENPKLFYSYDPSRASDPDYSELGMYAIVPQRIADLKKTGAIAVTGQTDNYVKGGPEGKYQVERADVTDEERNINTLSFLSSLSGFVGFGDAEVSIMNKKLQAIIDQHMRTRYGGNKTVVVSKAKGQ